MQVINISDNNSYSNTFLVKCNEQAILVDAGTELSTLLSALGEQKLVAVFLTHSHFDHIIFLEQIISHFPVPVYVTKNGEDKLYNADTNLSTSFDNYVALKERITTHIVADGDEISLSDNLNIKVIETKGHSNCSVCYLMNGVLFAGDMLFNNGIGRYDFFDSSKQDMLNSLIKLEPLTGYQLVYSGHGPSSDFARQQRNIRLHIKFLSRH